MIAKDVANVRIYLLRRSARPQQPRVTSSLVASKETIALRTQTITNAADRLLMKSVVQVMTKMIMTRRGSIVKNANSTCKRSCSSRRAVKTCSVLKTGRA